MRVYRQEANFRAAVRPQGADLVQILQHIESHSKDCSLSSLAQRFNFNPNYLGNLLKKRTGRTFLELLQSQRMNQAALLLKRSHKSIEDISAEVGYESLSFFYKKFSAHFGCSPGQYRDTPSAQAEIKPYFKKQL
jgi:YesN/AraC family two-component response regulator